MPEYKEFRIGDLFEPVKTGFVGKGEKIGSATKIPDAKHTVPLTCAKAGNNGIMYWGQPGDFITHKNTIAVIADGAISTGMIYAEPQETGVYSHSYLIQLVDRDVSPLVNLYLATVLEKVIYPKYTRENSCRWNKISDDLIYLPVIASGEPDFEYMENYIRELEHDCIKELEQERNNELETYLSITGLDDYELSEDDKVTLSLSRKTTSDEDGVDATVAGYEIEFVEFCIGDLFEKLTLNFIPNRKFDKRSDTSLLLTNEFNLPLVNAKHGDNGIMYYGRRAEWQSTEMSIAIIQNGAVATGDVYVQPQETGVLWDAYLITPKFEYVSVRILFFMASALEKSIKEKFDYDNKATWDKVKLNMVSLPATSFGTPDFEYMEHYIRAIEKLAIADEMKYRSKAITATREIVGD